MTVAKASQDLPAAVLDQDRAALAEAVQGGDLDRTRNAARRLLGRAASPARAAKLVRSLIEKAPPPGLKPVRLALLSSFSIELLEGPLIAHGYTEGLAITVYKPGFDQYQQQILDASAGLYAFGPDVIALAVDGRRWAPWLYAGPPGPERNTAPMIESTVSTVATLLEQLRRHTTAPVLLHSLPYPRYPALGILDATLEDGQRGVAAAINARLAGVCREHGAVYLVDVDAMAGSVGYDAWYDARMDLFARSPVGRSAMDMVARVYLRYLRAITGFSRKCVVVDLDNTVWGGLVGELGPRGIAVGSDYPGNAYVALQRALLALRDRGVLLAIASKNNLSDVEQAFDQNSAMALRLEHFAAQQIHWEPKSLSIARIAESLNLGLRHMVFVDDNPVECAEVELAHPSVTTIALPPQPERFVDALLGEGLFDSLSITAEDSRRASLYEQRDAAERLRGEAASVEDFYRSLQMRVYLEPVNADNIARAAQMTQKTTQFNATTRLYTEADLSARCRLEGWAMLTMRVVDRFGDNGIVGLLLAERCGDVYRIDTLLMSCRVINRGAETCLLHWLANRARADGARTLEGWIVPTARNVPVREVYRRHGFTMTGSTDQATRWELDLTAATVAAPAWLEIIDDTND